MMKRVVGGGGGQGPRILSVRAQMLAFCSRVVAWREAGSFCRLMDPPDVGAG